MRVLEHRAKHPSGLLERHRTERVGWLRAAVLGANDGIVSTASLIVGVAASHASHSAIAVAGVAGLIAGAMSMAAGEYVSVSSQADTERADLEREREELAAGGTAELEELSAIYVRRGLDPRDRSPSGRTADGSRCPRRTCTRRARYVGRYKGASATGSIHVGDQLRCRRGAPVADALCGTAEQRRAPRRRHLSRIPRPTGWIGGSSRRSSFPGWIGSRRVLGCSSDGAHRGGR